MCELDLQPVLDRRPFQRMDHSNACSGASFLVTGLTAVAQSSVLQMRSLPE
jgi:hypothetical protein